MANKVIIRTLFSSVCAHRFDHLSTSEPLESKNHVIVKSYGREWEWEETYDRFGLTTSWEADIMLGYTATMFVLK